MAQVEAASIELVATAAAIEPQPAREPPPICAHSNRTRPCRDNKTPVLIAPSAIAAVAIAPGSTVMSAVSMMALSMTAVSVTAVSVMAVAVMAVAVSVLAADLVELQPCRRPNTF